MDFLAPLYPWFKALHVISVISWMAGIFYLPRLFVRHAENQEKREVVEIFKVMEDKLFRIIMTPAMFASWLFAILTIATGLVDIFSVWFMIKLMAVIAMTFFHLWCGRQLRIFSLDQNSRKGRFFRLMNEVPTLLMILIVIMVIVKPV